MKNILFGLVVVLLSNYAVDASDRYKYTELKDRIIFYNDDGTIHTVYMKQEPAKFVLAIPNYQHESVQGFPTYAKCIVAKVAKIKKDGKPWDCFPVNYD